MLKHQFLATAACFSPPEVSAVQALVPTSIPKSPDDWLTPEAVEAEYPAFTASRLTKLRMGPGGPAFTKIGRAVMYRRGDLLEWLKANSRTMTNERRPGARSQEGGAARCRSR
jgi:hypothetical protein